MLTPVELAKEIETSTDILAVKVNGISIWPFLRIYYCFAQLNKMMEPSNSQKLLTKISRLKFRIKMLRNAIFRFSSIFRKYDFILVTPTTESRIVNGKYVSRNAGGILDYLKDSKVLIIEDPGSSLHTDYRKDRKVRILSLDLIKLIFKIKKSREVLTYEKLDLLEGLNKKYNLKVNYKSIISHFFSSVKVYSKLINKFNPKIIFMINYYNVHNQAIIFSAKQLGVKIIELQHGAITKTSMAYNIFTDMGNTFFPDHILTYGEYVNNIFFRPNNFFIKNENVHAVGYYYLEYILSDHTIKFDIQEKIKAIKSKYSKLICVSSQVTVDKKLIDFINAIAVKDLNIAYIFVPRRYSDDYPLLLQSSNIFIFPDLNVYESINISDFHVTVYSTCAVEAPAMGIRNILIDIDNLSTSFFGDILTDIELTKIVSTHNEFFEALSSFSQRSKQSIIEGHGGFYMPNHKKLIAELLDRILANDS